MGFNSAILILNDRLSEIEAEPVKFVREMISATLRVGHPFERTPERLEHVKHHGIDFYPGQSTAITCHHADMTSVIAMGGNHATVLGKVFGRTSHHTPEGQIALLRDLAELYGFRLVRKPQPKT